MSIRHAVRNADPAQHLPAHELDAGDEQLLREILATDPPVGSPSRAATSYPRRRRVSRLRPVLITGATAVALIAVSVGVLHLTGRTAVPAAPDTEHPAARLLDPLQEITDRSSQLYVSDAPEPILHVRAGRSGTFALDVPAGTASVRFYLVCTAGSTYTLRTDTEEEGGCRGSIGGYTDQPADELQDTVRVTVPAGTAYILLAIPTPTETSTPGPPVQLPQLAYPDDAAPAGEPLIGHARSTTSARVTGAMTAAARSLLVVITCRGSGTIVISTEDGFTHGSAAESPDPEVCGSTEPITSTYGDEEQGGMEHYGPMDYAIQPVGQVSWTVSFYDAH